jgi:hypothetical protein
MRTVLMVTTRRGDGLRGSTGEFAACPLDFGFLDVESLVGSCRCGTLWRTHGDRAQLFRDVRELFRASLVP